MKRLILIITTTTTTAAMSTSNLDGDKTKYFLMELVLGKNYLVTVVEKYEKDEECSICLETLKDTEVMMIPCGHDYHKSCTLELFVDYGWLQCPAPDCSTSLQFFGSKTKTS